VRIASAPHAIFWRSLTEMDKRRHARVIEATKANDVPALLQAISDDLLEAERILADGKK
jgi:hypothetical protein